MRANTFVITALAVFCLFVSTLSFGQAPITHDSYVSQSLDPAANAITKEAQWIQDMVSKHKISPADANERLMHLIQEMGGLARGASSNATSSLSAPSAARTDVRPGTPAPARATDPTPAAAPEPPGNGSVSSGNESTNSANVPTETPGGGTLEPHLASSGAADAAPHPRAKDDSPIPSNNPQKDAAGNGTVQVASAASPAAGGGAAGAPNATVEPAVSPAPCSLVRGAPKPTKDEKGNDTTTYTYTVSCIGVPTPTAVAIWPTLGKVGNTLIEPRNLIGLDAPQYGPTGAKVNGYVTLSVKKNAKAESFDIEVPNNLTKTTNIAGMSYIVASDGDLATCKGAASSTSTCFVAPITLPGVHEDSDLQVTQPYQVLVGMNIAGASGTDPRATLLSESKYDLPLSTVKSNNITARWFLSSSARVSAIQSTDNLTSLLTTTNGASAAQNVFNQNPSQIVQSFELRLPYSSQHRRLKRSGTKATVKPTMFLP